MMHYALIVVEGQRISAQWRREIKKACQTHGLRHTGYDAMKKAAVELSKLPGVDRVVVTRVNEENEGTWRKGRRS